MLYHDHTTLPGHALTAAGVGVHEIARMHISVTIFGRTNGVSSDLSIHLERVAAEKLRDMITRALDATAHLLPGAAIEPAPSPAPPPLADDDMPF